MMSAQRAFRTSLLGLIATAAWAQSGAAKVSPAEKVAGWKLLFDGQLTGAWRGYKSDKFPAKGWIVEGDALKCTGEGGGDIITREQYGDFELELEFKVGEKGNSGIIYRVAETLDASWQTGPEFQLLDDAGHGFAATDPHSCGALYDLAGPAAGKILKPVGEYNQARVRVKDGVVQHFLNGVKVVDCRIDQPEWSERIKKSKFGEFKGFGVQPKGHIALQDHGGALWFRNIRIRDLSAAMASEKKLFNGKDMSGWTAFLQDNGKLEDVWSVKDGVMICKGQPIGYIRTLEDYTNFVLKLEWRFNPVTKQAGNSGVLLRLIGADMVWPRSVEAQLQSESAGDFWNIEEFPMKTVAERTNGRNTRKTHGAERPIGEWNEYEIIVDHAKVTLRVNGETLNEAWEVLETPGKIALQSEGAEIHFRNIRLAPIP